MVSLIVPVYQVEAYLPACLDSVLAQTCPHWECILIDDGSFDRSGEICDAYAAADARFRVIRQANGGVSAARNTGLAAAKGDYVAFLDSDDRLTPDFLERLLPSMEAGVDLAICEYRRICADGTPFSEGADEHAGEYLLDADLPCERTQEGERYTVTDRILTAFWEVGALNSACLKLYRRQQIEALSLRFDTDLHFAEDMRFATAYATSCTTVELVSRPLYLYLWREGSATTAPRPGMLTQRYRGLMAIAEGFAMAGYLSTASAVRDTLDHLTPEPFLERMQSAADRRRLVVEYCSLPNYSGMMKAVRETRSKLTAAVYATRSPRILYRYLAVVLKRRGRDKG